MPDSEFESLKPTAWNRQSETRSRRPYSPSGSARILTLLLTVPALFLLDTPADFIFALLLAALCWVTASWPVRPWTADQPNPFLLMRSFLWLGPGLVLLNGLLAPGRGTWGPFSRAGLLIGLLIVGRLMWAASMAIVLIRTCPPQQLLSALRAGLRLLRIPDRGISFTLFLTLEILPQFADIRITDFGDLPKAITRRLKSIVLPAFTPSQPHSGQGLLRPTDAIIILPSAGLILFAALS